MNQYKIEVKEILKKNINVSAENEKEALDFVENAYSKSNLLEPSLKDIEEVEAKIIEKDNEKIEEDDDEKKDNFLVNLVLKMEKLQNEIDEILDKIEEVLEEI